MSRKKPGFVTQISGYENYVTQKTGFCHAKYNDQNYKLYFWLFISPFKVLLFHPLQPTSI